MHGLSRWCCGQITPIAKGRLVWIRAEGMLYSVFFFFLTQSPHMSLKRISSHLKVTLFFLLGKGDSRGKNNLERNSCKESEFL